NSGLATRRGSSRTSVAPLFSTSRTPAIIVVKLPEERESMPLRDHFRPPVSKVASWEAVHGGWPMVIVQTLAPKLPQRYVAHPRVHLGSFAEIDVSAYEKDVSPALHADNSNGEVATEDWAPSRPTLAVV